MKTWKNLKDMIVGEVFNGAMFVIVVVLVDWIKSGDLDVTLLGISLALMAGITAAAIVVTYVGYHIRKGVSGDVEELKRLRKEKKDKALARA